MFNVTNFIFILAVSLLVAIANGIPHDPFQAQLDMYDQFPDKFLQGLMFGFSVAHTSSQCAAAIEDTNNPSTGQWYDDLCDARIKNMTLL